MSWGEARVHQNGCGQGVLWTDVQRGGGMDCDAVFLRDNGRICPKVHYVDQQLHPLQGLPSGAAQVSPCLYGLDVGAEAT